MMISIKIIQDRPREPGIREDARQTCKQEPGCHWNGSARNEVFGRSIIVPGLARAMTPRAIRRWAAWAPIDRAVGAIHSMHRGHVRSHVTLFIMKSRYLHFPHSLVKIVPNPQDGLPYSLRAKPTGKECSMLVLSRKLGEKIVIGDRVVVTVVKLDNSQVRLGIEAPQEIGVFREEIAPRLPLVQPIV